MKLLILFFISYRLYSFDYLGFYAYPDKKYVNILKNSEFNILLTYGSELQKKKNMEDFLNYAKLNKISVIFSTKDTFETSKWYPKKQNIFKIENGNNFLKYTINQYKNNKAILGWYLTDEPTATVGKNRKYKVKQHSRIIRALSNKKLFCEDFSLPRGLMWDTLDKNCDVLMTAIYPIPDENILSVYNKLKLLKNKYKYKKIIAVLQIFGKYQYPYLKKNIINGRAPNINEIIVMNYLSLFAGVNGIIYYSLRDLINQKGYQVKLHILNQNMKQFKILNKQINTISWQIKNIMIFKNQGYIQKNFETKTKRIRIIVNITNHKVKTFHDINLSPYQVKVIKILEGKK